eukprot:Lankesteria_metandrocarpae@DN4055_c0_g1_i4.p1
MIRGTVVVSALLLMLSPIASCGLWKQMTHVVHPQHTSLNVNKASTSHEAPTTLTGLRRSRSHLAGQTYLDLKTLNSDENLSSAETSPSLVFEASTSHDDNHEAPTTLTGLRRSRSHLAGQTYLDLKTLNSDENLSSAETSPSLVFEASTSHDDNHEAPTTL